jgi:alpha-glucosidase (family GH31 glycosyl hydrolase)
MPLYVQYAHTKHRGQLLNCTLKTFIKYLISYMLAAEYGIILKDAGDTPDEIVESYADVTGKVPMMPEYGLGFWQCKLRYYNQEQLLEVAREYKRRNLPIDVIVCDFFHWPKMGDFPGI